MTYQNKTFTLEPTKISYSIREHFPELKDPNKRVAIATSGGMESTLIAKICLDIYGPDKTVLLYSDNMFSGSDPDLNKNILVNVNNIKTMLGVEPIYLDIDHKLHEQDKMSSYAKITQSVNEKYNIEFTMWGFTKLFFDVSEFKEDATATHQTVIERCFEDPIKYYSIIEGFHLDTGLYSEYVKNLDIPGDVYQLLRYDRMHGQNIRTPFAVLDKPEVVDLYRQLGLMELVYQTHSCITETVSEKNLHCGRCFNCQQRYDAFATLGLEDKTEYDSNFLKEARQKMEEAMKQRLSK